MRRLVAAITYAELLAWARYLNARNAPPRPWIRDADQIEQLAALIYGGQEPHR